MSRFGAAIDHGAVDKTIDPALIKKQISTAKALRSRLDDHGGVILGDEVGSGKTYVTFALLVDALANDPKRGAVIFVPSQLLKRKWCEQLREYIGAAVTDRDFGKRLSSRIAPVDRTLCDDGSLDPDRRGRKPSRNAIVVTTHNVYSYRTSEADQAACLRAAAAQLDIGRPIRPRALLKACGVNPDTHSDWADWAKADVLTPKRLRPLQDVLAAYAEGYRGLGDEARNAILEIRRLVGSARLPDAALVVIDEAHHLKSTDSTVYLSLKSVLSRRFDALLFLTATPFQLGRSELLNIVNFFRWSRVHDGRGEAFDKRVNSLRSSMDNWVDTLDAFIRVWGDLSEEQAATCVRLIDGVADGGVEVGALERRGADSFATCLDARERLEAAMRPFVVRSVRDRDHREHGSVDREFLTDETRIPLALVDRLLVERMQGERTFISSALVSACSSWDALSTAAIMGDSNDESRTRPVLRRMLERDLMGRHPKVEQTLSVCARGLDAGEKTLVFVERQQTGLALRDDLKKQTDTHFDGEDGPSDASLRQRLQDRTRFGWPSLRENYLHTIFPLVFDEQPDSDEVKAIWAEPRWRRFWSRVDPDDEKRDYGIEKRFWEHALFERAAARHRGWTKGLDGPLRASVHSLLQPEYVLNGLDLVAGSSGECREVPSQPQRAQLREPRTQFAKAFIAYRSPWVGGRDNLAALRPNHRAAFVDAAASAIAVSHFRQELARKEIDGDPEAHFKAMNGLILDRATDWPRRFDLLADQAREAVQIQNESIAEERINRLIDALGQTQRVQYIDGGTSTETKENAVAGFNTPLYPEVIVTTEVLAEGLDLHRSCRRVIHHDLPWNPAKLEQRTGRVDRVGSLSERLAKEAPDDDHRIDVWLPFVPGTYDQFVYERVMSRRREFRCILGNRPEWQAESLGKNEVGVAIDESLVKRLQVDLRPRQLESSPDDL